jgi:hypothetical protein
LAATQRISPVQSDLDLQLLTAAILSAFIGTLAGHVK